MNAAPLSRLYEIYLQNPSVQTDTRRISKGDIFFALKGPNFDGNSFVPQALQEGAVCAVTDDKQYEDLPGAFYTEDVLTCLQALARMHRQHFSIPFIAITGSNGKTTTKELVQAVLRRKFKTYATAGNLNNHIGVPLTLLSIKADAAMAIIEMGANHLHEIESYCRIALPTHGIITNCGKAHLEGFGSVEGVRKGKGELYDFLRDTNGTIFRNTDLDYLEDMSRGIAQQITYGTANADYIGKATTHGLFVGADIDTPDGTVALQSNLTGDYNFPNLMLAFALGAHFGVPNEDITAAVAEYFPDNSRSQLLQQGSNKIILDAYNANPGSMRAAIDNMAKIEAPNKMLWLGAMKEMGNEEAYEHQSLLDYADKFFWAEVILVGEEFKPFAQGKKWFADADAAAASVAQNKPENALILIKGSRGSRMEKMLAAL